MFDDDNDARFAGVLPLQRICDPGAMQLPALDTTYTFGRHEEGWLLDSLGEYFEDQVLTDVLYAVRGGKEANVYCCRGGPALDDRLVAAKIYRPRKHRELRNDAVYREGRGLLDGRGHRERAGDRRLGRAVRKGSRVGKEAAHTSWVMHEFSTLAAMYDAGGSVPEPIAVSKNAILMGFVGDEDGAAPTLDRARLEPPEVPPLFEEALRNIELLLSLGWVHGDLSAYNLMVWEGRLTVIDLPQVCDVFGNPNALGLYLRDVERVCAYFDRQRDPREVADELWRRVFETEGGVPDTPIAWSAPVLRRRD